MKLKYLILLVSLLLLACAALGLEIKTSGSVQTQCVENQITVEIEGGLITEVSNCKEGVVKFETTAGAVEVIFEKGAISVESDSKDLNCHVTTENSWECQKPGTTIWIDIAPVVPTPPPGQVL